MERSTNCTPNCCKVMRERKEMRHTKKMIEDVDRCKPNAFESAKMELKRKFVDFRTTSSCSSTPLMASINGEEVGFL